jgi:hypothetical protein
MKKPLLLSAISKHLISQIGMLVLTLAMVCFQNNAAVAQYCLAPTTNETITPTTTSQTTTAYSSGARAFNFAATSGCAYTFATCNLSTADTYLRLYSTGTGGTQLVGADDNCGVQSSFTWTCTASGTYSVLLTNYSCAALTSATAMSYSTTCSTTPPPSGGCTYSIALYDTYGDGWNGGTVTVNVGGTNALTAVTLSSGSGPATYNFTVYQGQSITVNYTAGSWSSENYYSVFNAANGGGTQLYQSPMYSTPPASQAITNGCTSPMPACTGTPTPGATLATYTAVPVGGTTVLSVQTPYPLATYQWQSGPSSTGPWTNITGATGSSYTLTYSTPTYYRCMVYCGVNSASSTPLQIVTGPCISTSYYGAGSGYYGMINSVNFNTLSHTALGSLPSPYYAAYPASTTTTSVMAGVTYNLILNTGYYNAAGAWFDWNNNAVFETTEYVSFGTNTSWTMWGGTQAVTVPGNAYIGQIAMRIRTEYAGYTLNSGSACTTLTYGETKDFRITVIAAPNCAGTPNAGSATISAATGCPNQSVTVTASGLSIGSGISYQWQSAPSATGPWTNITGATGLTYTSNVSATTYYRMVTVCLYSASSNNSNVVSFTPAGGQCQCGAYPAVYSYYTYDEEISNVTVGTMNNSSTCSTTAPGPGSVNQIYSNYTGAVTGPTANQGDLVNFSVTQTTCGGNYTNIFQIFVDFNQDGDFLDAGEFVYNQPVGVSGNHTKTGSFLVPANATLGTTRMRVVNAESGPTTTNYAHNVYYYGETEDYCFTVTLPPPCAGTPTPGNTLAAPNSVFAGQTTVLTLQNNTSGTGVTYQWQSGPSSTGPWTNITGATSYTYTATPTATTWYRCVVTCTNSASSTPSTPVQVLYNPYCNPAYYYGTQYGDLISNVAITGTTLNNNSGTATSGPAYTYYSNLPAAVMQAASSYQVQVTCGSFAYQAFAVWIDYNDNYTFEASEKVGFSTAYTTTSFQTVSFNINLACTPPLGLHRMRVRGVYYTPGSTIDPCATYYYGETEDYNVQIIAAVPFSPSFSAVPATQACTYTDYVYTTQAGMQNYTWTLPGTAGVNYNIISGGTTTSNTMTVQYLTGGNQTVSINYLNASGCTSTGAVSNTITVQSTAQIAPLSGTQTVCAGATVSFATTSTGGTWSSSNTAVALVNPSTGVVTGVSAGTATITYTIPNPTTWCPPSTATRTVTVLPSPIVNAGNDVTICSGNTSNMNATVNFNTSCSHTITMYDSFGDGWNGCSVTVSVGGVPVLTNITLATGAGPLAYTFTASNGAPIQITFTAGSWIYEPYFTITNGAGTNLVTNWFPGSSGTWNGTASGCPSITPTWTPATGLSAANILNPVASPTATTTYTVSATGTNGCVGTDQVVVNVNPSPANAPVIAPSVLCVGNNGMVSNPVPNGTWATSNGSILSLNPATGDIVGVSAGNATVSYTTTATNGCTATTSATVAVQAIPVATITSSNGNSICQGTATTLTAPAAASYSWNNGATTQTISVTAGGSYSVIITSAAGCVSNPSAPLALTVNQPPVANVAVNGPTTFCQGGSVVLTASGGTSYAWSNSVPSATNTISQSGTYTAVVTNAAGCSATSAPITVTVNPAPAASITANGPTAFCAGGSVILSATGPGSYVWSNGSTASSVAVNTSSSLSYTVTDANGCTTTTAPTVVTVTALPVVPAILGNNTVCQGASTLFTNAATTGVWTSSNAAVASVDATGNVTGVTGGNATISYTVTTNGCSTTQVKNISVQTAPVTSITASGPTTFCAGGSVVLTAGSGAAYAWTNSTSTQQSITVTTSGTYGVAVTSGQGCAAIAPPVTVTVVAYPVLDPIAGSNALCVGSIEAMTNTTTGGVWASSNPSVASVSASGAVTANAAGAATISYTFTNATGCATTVTKPIAVNMIPSAVTTISGPTTFCAGASVTLTAPAATSYLWSTNETTQSITVSTSGNYHVDVTTAGCMATSATIPVVVNALPSPVVTTNNVAICQGTTATLTSTPAVSYLWSNNATTASIAVNQAGNYTVTVTDANGCSDTSAPLAISVSALPVISITAAGPTTFCQGASVTLNASTAAAYNWSNGATTPSITVSSSGLYFVTATNPAGCTATSNEIQVNAQQAFVPVITAASPTTVCQGALVTLVASPGVSYLWSYNNTTTQGVNVATNGPVTVTVTNSLGCVGTSAPVNVTVLPTPTTTISASGPLTFCEGGSVNLTAAGASTYVWEDATVGAALTATTSGTYVVTGYGANGCPDLAEITVTVNAAPSTSLILDGNNSLCPGETLEISAQPGNLYNWNPSNLASQSISVTTPGTYSCTLTALNGCTSNSEVIVVTAASPTSSTINATATDEYVLNEVIYTQSGTYTQTLLNAQGCDSTITLNLTLTAGLDENGFVVLNLQPNPTDAVFTVSSSLPLYSHYSIHDAQGKVVAEGNLTGSITTLNIDQVARGIYFLKVAEASEALRIVKN